jgi:uncharacterized membrane protein
MDRNSLELEHDVFRVSIFLKGLYSFFELLAGAVLLFGTSDRIFNFIHHIFRNELLEDAHDFIGNFVISLVGNLPQQMKVFIALYLLSHGIVKLALIIALWKEKRWAYPIAMGVFGLFIVYQIYRYILHPSLILLFLNDLDMVVIILTLLEWRRLKHRHWRKI